MLSSHSKTPDDRPVGEPSSSGLGLFITETPCGTSYGHGGRNGGYPGYFTSQSEVYRDRKVGCVFLTNNDQGPRFEKVLRTFLVTLAPVDPGVPLEIPRLRSTVTLDGRSDEPAWEGIQPLPMVMQLPSFGDKPSEAPKASGESLTSLATPDGFPLRVVGPMGVRPSAGPPAGLLPKLE